MRWSEGWKQTLSILFQHVHWWEDKVPWLQSNTSHPEDLSVAGFNQPSRRQKHSIPAQPWGATLCRHQQTPLGDNLPSWPSLGPDDPWPAAHSVLAALECVNRSHPLMHSTLISKPCTTVLRPLTGRTVLEASSEASSEGYKPQFGLNKNFLFLPWSTDGFFFCRQCQGFVDPGTPHAPAGLLCGCSSWYLVPSLGHSALPWQQGWSPQGLFLVFSWCLCEVWLMIRNTPLVFVLVPAQSS